MGFLLVYDVIRDEAEYLALHNCLQHLSMVEESVVALGKGFEDNCTSMKIRSYLNDCSREWKVYFEQESKFIIRLQSWFRVLLAMKVRRRLEEEREWHRHQRRIWTMNIKWEIRRALGTYTDRRKKVFKRDFLKLWKDTMHSFRDDKEKAAIKVQSIARIALAKAEVRRVKEERER